MKALFEFRWDCGRMGTLEGLFIAEKEDVEKAIGKQVYFGEVLGKHSEIYGELEKDEIKLITEDKIVINKCEEIFKSPTLSGYNPLDYINTDPTDDGD